MRQNKEICAQICSCLLHMSRYCFLCTCSVCCREWRCYMHRHSKQFQRRRPHHISCTTRIQNRTTSSTQDYVYCEFNIESVNEHEKHMRIHRLHWAHGYSRNNSTEHNKATYVQALHRPRWLMRRSLTPHPEHLQAKKTKRHEPLFGKEGRRLQAVNTQMRQVWIIKVTRTPAPVCACDKNAHVLQV